MRRTTIALLLSLSTGCATGYKASYVTGAVTKQFATESYSIYSGEFNGKIDDCCSGDVCNPESENVITKTELDQCMGAAYEKSSHEKIEKYVKLYHEAAKIHTEAMRIVDGNDEEKQAATAALLESAINLLDLLPDGDKLVAKLKKLIGR